MAHVEFMFDFGSPAAYIAHKALPAIAAKAGADLTYSPMLLGGVFKTQGNQPPAMITGKGAWMGGDMARFRKKYGITDFAFNDAFPINTIALMRGAVAYEGTELYAPYIDACFNGVWRDNRNMGDGPVVAEVLAPLGITPDHFMAKIGDQAVKDSLKAKTEAATNRGVFGAPTFFVGDAMHFGQDRLFLVAEDLGVDIRDVYPDY